MANAVEPTLSQSYLTHVAARAIILIQADDPVIGLMAVIPVGMVEVSSCVIDPEIVPGHHVNKGDELGYFQFGGSTECLSSAPVLSTSSLSSLSPNRRIRTHPSCGSGRSLRPPSPEDDGWWGIAMGCPDRLWVDLPESSDGAESTPA